MVTVDIDNMSVLDRRRIEAMVLGPVIRAFQSEFGEERTNDVVRRVIVDIARGQGRKLADRAGGDDLESFASSKGPWRRGHALKTQELARSAGRYDFNVTRCRYAEMYDELGCRDLGAILSCARDFVFGEGFNSKIALTRTQTIMGGASFCDFRDRLQGNERRQSEDRGDGEP